MPVVNMPRPCADRPKWVMKKMLHHKKSWCEYLIVKQPTASTKCTNRRNTAKVCSLFFGFTKMWSDAGRPPAM